MAEVAEAAVDTVDAALVEAVEAAAVALVVVHAASSLHTSALQAPRHLGLNSAPSHAASQKVPKHSERLLGSNHAATWTNLKANPTTKPLNSRSR